MDGRLPEAYFYHRADSRMFSALGTEKPPQGRIWVGQRSYDLRQPDSPPTRNLTVFPEPRGTLEVPRQPGPGLSPRKVEFEWIGEKTLRVTLGKENYDLQPGSDQTLYSNKIHMTKAQWTEWILADPGWMKLDIKTARRLADRTFGSSDTLAFFVRATVKYHGRVRPGPFDLLHEWSVAREAASSGRYKESELACQRLVTVLSNFREARELKAGLADLIAREVRPALLRGTVTFPGDFPTDEDTALEKRFGKGHALLAQPDSPAGSAFSAVPIVDGAFSASLPQGKYRLTIAVPGFSPVEQIVELKTDMSVSITLKRPQ